MGTGQEIILGSTIMIRSFKTIRIPSNDLNGWCNIQKKKRKTNTIGNYEHDKEYINNKLT